MTALAKILLVDDDADMRQLTSQYLRKAHYDTQTLPDGDALVPTLTREPPDLLLLDLMLPGTDGLALCKSLRADLRFAHIPVIMLTAKDSTLDRVVGLEMGADDYLSKPFEPLELLARIKAVLRRTQPQAANAPSLAAVAHNPNRMLFHGWTLELHTRQLLSPQHVVISLASSDFRILHHLLSHPHCPVSRDQLMGIAFGRERVATDRAVDVCISRLRAHLEVDARQPRLIRTVRHEGYMYSPGAAEEGAVDAEQ